MKGLRADPRQWILTVQTWNLQGQVNSGVEGLSRAVHESCVTVKIFNFEEVISVAGNPPCEYALLKG